MKKILLLLLCTIAVNSHAISDKAYIAQVTKVLTKNPNDIDTIYMAGNYFFKKKNYKMAIWYFASPALFRHPKFVNSKIKYGYALLKEKKYRLAYLQFKYLLSLKLPTFHRQIIRRKLNECLKFYNPFPSFYLALPYYAKLDYDANANKDSGSVVGVYFSRTRKYKTLEMFYEKTAISYKSALKLTDLSQTNMGAFYSWFTGYSWKHRVGGHYITSTDTLSDKAWMVTYGATYFPALYNEIALDLYMSKYPTYSTGLTVMQGDLTYRRSLNKLKTLNLSLKLMTIKTNLKLFVDAAEQKDLFVSYNIGVNYIFKRFKFAYDYSGGQKVFSIESAGLAMYNTNSVYTKVHTAAITATLSTRIFTTLKYSSATYHLSGTKVMANSSVIAAMLGVNF